MNNIANVLKLLAFLDGYKTYVAAAGLFGLSLYQVSQGQFEAAIQSFMGGLAAVGVRHAVAKNNEEQKLLLKRKLKKEEEVEEDK